MRFMNGDDGAPVRDLMMYLSVEEAEELVSKLNELLRNPEASEHDHCYDFAGGFEMSFSIITPTKLSDMSGYTESERSLLAGEFDGSTTTHARYAGTTFRPADRVLSANSVYPNFLHMFEGPIMVHHLGCGAREAGFDQSHAQVAVGPEERVIGRFMHDGDTWIVEGRTPFESLAVAAASMRFSPHADPFVRVTDDRGRSFLELSPTLLGGASSQVAQIRLPKA